MRLDLRSHGTRLLRRLCRRCHSAMTMSIQLFSTRGICSIRSSMVLVGKHVHLYCWCWHTEHISMMMVIPGICQTDSAGLSKCLSYGAYPNTKCHPWKISPVQTCTLPKQRLFHFLVERELMWPWCWCSWTFFCNWPSATHVMTMTNMFCRQCINLSKALWISLAWCIVTTCGCRMGVQATWWNKDCVL